MMWIPGEGPNPAMRVRRALFCGAREIVDCAQPAFSRTRTGSSVRAVPEKDKRASGLHDEQDNLCHPPRLPVGRFGRPGCATYQMIGYEGRERRLSLRRDHRGLWRQADPGALAQSSMGSLNAAARHQGSGHHLYPINDEFHGRRGVGLGVFEGRRAVPCGWRIRLDTRTSDTYRHHD